MRDLYRLALKLLTNFTYQNTENQLLIYDYVRIIESFKGNLLNTKDLLGEVLKCKRNTEVSVKIIEKIFLLMYQRENPMERPQDLAVIKNLLFDDDLKFFYANQTTTIKMLLASKSLQKIFSSETSWDLSNNSAKSIKFFSTMIEIISWCSIFNDYATQQARRMIPYQVTIREMEKTTILLVKKAYLHFLFYVFFMKSDNIHRDLPDTVLEDVLENIVLADLAKYKKYLDHLVTLSLKGMYHPVTITKIVAPNPRIEASQVKNKKVKSSKRDSLSKEQAEALEY